MFILARGGATYARLKFRAGPGGAVLLPIQIDWGSWPLCLDDPTLSVDSLVAYWQREYATNFDPDPGPWFPSLEQNLSPEDREILEWEALWHEQESLLEKSNDRPCRVDNIQP